MKTAPALEHGERIALAQKLLAAKRELSAAVNDEFFRRHPDWLERYGAYGVQKGFEDAGYHIEYLAAAVETGSLPLFETYARWTSRVLESRGIASRFLAENFQQVEAALRPRLTPAEFAMVSRLLQAGAAALSEPAEAHPTSTSDTWRRLFLASILRGQRDATLNIALDALSHGLTVTDFHTDVCARSLHDVGEMWERNRIAVADEHIATAVAQYVIAQLYPRIPLPDRRRGNVIVTGVEGELHQLGANIFADILESEGWTAFFLGSNLPHSGILAKIEEHRAAAVCISVTMPFNIPQAQRLVAAIRSRFGSKIRILLGGQAFRNVPEFLQESGADAWAPDARQGAALLVQLTES
jgi:MerR family transcriptional regulator, light-induced transcriptional regulator